MLDEDFTELLDDFTCDEDDFAEDDDFSELLDVSFTDDEDFAELLDFSLIEDDDFPEPLSLEPSGVESLDSTVYSSAPNAFSNSS